MDECMLNDLLECSVCLERLDTSSKVLPCQHTFCKKCLEDILTTHKELRCPECRVLIDIKIDDLPPNVLLMRILEGMRNAPKKQHQRVLVRGQHTNQTAPVHQHQYVNQVSQITTDRIQVSNKGPTQQIVSLHQPHAKALYDYQSKEPDDLSFKKGDLILLRKKIDTHWYFGESNGKQGVFPSIYVDILIPLPPHIPQCKALYDFRMTGEDEEGCLAFNKGAVINVIRRVDENWAEGRLNERVGIFPLAFVELNGLARSLMKLSTNCQPGPSRVAPPTPTEESPPVILTDHSNSVTTTASVVHPTTTPQIVTSSLQVGSESTSTTTSSSSPSTTPNTSSSNTSSSSSTAPSSPSSPPPRNGPNNVSSPPHRPTPPAPLMLRVSSSQNAEQKEKRHSFSSLNVGHHHHTSHRHSAEILSTDVAEQDRSRRSGDNSTHAPPVPAQNNHGTSATVSHAPAAYVALYPYKPQKPDELELRKGGIYMVTERCQDGWFKGTSNRTQKCGVFPGNYVALARNVTRITSSGIPQQTASPRNGPALEPRNSSGMFQNRTSVTNSSMTSARQPPELPPRSTSPSSATTSTVSCSWHGQPDNTATVPLGRSQSAVMATSSPATIQSTNVGGVQGQMKPAEKNKERKEKGTVSLMRRLTSMKRSKSPPAVGYSMDNPVFEDKTVSTHTHSPSHPVHVRSGSCPSQLLQTLPVNVESKLSGTSSQRLKERLHIMQVTSVPAHTRHGEASSVATTSSPRLNHHRKTNSLDATTKTKPATTTGSSVPVTPGRERFRCIVPYPPNSEYELELKLNDIIYVHKKRDDGWYKGTQQRTGRTGLFPASFVESF